MINKIKIQLKPSLFILFSIILSSCNLPVKQALNQSLVDPLPSETPYQPIPWTHTPPAFSETSTPLPPPYALWVHPDLPEEFISSVILPADMGITADPERGDWRLEINHNNPDLWWVYALVAPFPTVVDEVSKADLLQAWKGDKTSLFENTPLMLSESTHRSLSAFLGPPAQDAVEIIPPADLLDKAWQSGNSWAIVPFQQLNPRWKVLSIQGVSPIHKDYNPESYPLALPIALTGGGTERPIVPSGNRDPEKMTVVAITGVTAMVRATAFTMEQLGMTYPARDIASLLQQADITHISNEVPFAEDCPYPNPVQEGMLFCSDDRYIELLEYVGTDVVELTGDHFSDWGSEAMIHTLELYDQHGWLYYGGGKNREEGMKAALISHNGNQLAFIGCNAKGGVFAQASENNPGAVACDFEWMAAEIKRLRQRGILPIATLQHFEYYTYAAQPNQVRDAERLTKAGAVIVSGSQAHQPQAFAFSNGGFIHHGLGNLFFDQLDVSLPTRQAFIDRHIFYDGRHISTELLTIWFEDYARTRPMSHDERLTLLQSVFQASGW